MKNKFLNCLDIDENGFDERVKCCRDLLPDPFPSIPPALNVHIHFRCDGTAVLTKLPSLELR